MVNESEALKIKRILEYVGFYDSAQRTVIVPDGFKSYDNILMLGESYTVNLDMGLYGSTGATGKIRFVLR